MFENKIVRKILLKYKPLYAISHSLALMGWDNETYMPKGASSERGIATAELSILRQKLFLAKSFSGLVEKAKKLRDSNQLNEYESGVIRVLDRDLKFYQKVPKKVISDLEKTRVEAQVAWESAKSKNDFKKFKPYLSKLIEINKKIAEHYGYEKHPYDALIDLHEEGMTTEEFNNIFEQVRTQLSIILDGVLKRKTFPQYHEIEAEKYDKDNMHKLSLEILKNFSFSPEFCRLDVSAHPFTQSIGINDIRITTRYSGINFKEALSSLIHEYGHGLYDMQCNPKFAFTPLVSGPSYGTHESQSRFWENHILKSREFSESYYQLIKHYLPFMEKYSADELYNYLNVVRPSLIRTEADEITYHFHILLRFEIEKALIEGSLDVIEAPDEWQNKMEKYLGIRPTTDSEGILQDVHWSHGSFGYFPTYTIGSILAAQIAARIEKDIGKISELITAGEFTKIREWLRENMHKYGSMYSPSELIIKTTGEQLNPEHFLKYLKHKYLRQL